MRNRSQDGSNEPTKTGSFWNGQREIHKELSATVRRSMFAMLAYSVSCAIIIAQPDVPFVLASSGVKIPIINADVNLKAFLIVGPLGLVAITIYLHLFFAKLEQITGLDEYDKQPFLFNFQDKFSRVITILIFYTTPPILMLGFSWKSAVNPNWAVLTYLATMMVAAGMLILHQKTKLRYRWLIILGIVALAVMAFLSFFLGNYFSRGLNLEHAQLAETKIRGVNLKRANLRFANLSKADLKFNNLSEADLREADLREADLRGAWLFAANLMLAKLSKANLSGANLREANLSGADLSGADLSRADLSRAQYLTDSMLCLSFTINGAKLDPELNEQIQKECPDLLKNP